MGSQNQPITSLHPPSLQGSNEMCLVLIFSLQVSILPYLQRLLTCPYSPLDCTGITMTFWGYGATCLKRVFQGPYPSAAAVSMVKECYVEDLIQGKCLQQPWGGLSAVARQKFPSSLPSCVVHMLLPINFQITPFRFGLGVSVSPAYLLFAVACSSTHPSSSLFYCTVFQFIRSCEVDH